jgi:hypothetical protein
MKIYDFEFYGNKLHCEEQRGHLSCFFDDNYFEKGAISTKYLRKGVFIERIYKKEVQANVPLIRSVAASTILSLGMQGIKLNKIGQSISIKNMRIK